MGNCLGKLPASRDDFRIQNHEIMTALHQIDGNVRLLCEQTICPTAKQRSIDSTVLIQGASGGHGILIFLSSANYVDYYVLTAAHVAVHFVGKQNIHLTWNPQESTDSLTFRVTDVLVPKDYVADGCHDVGLIGVEFDRCTLKGMRDFTVMIDGTPSASGVVVGEGSDGFHLRGERVQPVTDSKDRLLIHAPSKGGMSGLPLFQAKGELSSLLHGKAKHRGGHVTGTHSAFVYADSIPKNLEFFSINKKYREAIVKAEDMDDWHDLSKEAHLSPHEIGVSSSYKEFEELSEMLHGSEIEAPDISVNEMLKQLADKCFTGNAVKIGDSVRVVTNVPEGTAKNAVGGHKLSQGHTSAISSHSSEKTRQATNWRGGSLKLWFGRRGGHR